MRHDVSLKLSQCEVCVRPEEQFAQAVVQELRPTLTLRYVDQQSNGEPDFEILDPDGDRVGVLEVTTLCDQVRLEETRLLHGKRRLSRVPRVRCAHSWTVSIAEGVPLKPVHTHLDALLHEAEALQLDSVNRMDPPALELYARLKTLTGKGTASVFNEGPHHHLVQEAYALWEDEGSVNEALMSLLQRKDDLRKLMTYGRLPERHLFVRVHLTSKKACQQLMCSDALPKSDLPDHVTDLWLVPTHIWTESTLAIWHMRAGCEWSRLTLANGFTPSR